MTDKYKEAGVDIELGDSISKSISSSLRKKYNMKSGLFSGFYPIENLKDYNEPMFLSSMDGVGTKLKIACMAGKYKSIGQDIVNHCVDDIIVHNAKPLFFLDYLAFEKLSKQVIEEVMTGMFQACSENGLSLVGGETAEMPGVYERNMFDIAGTIVGIADKEKIIDGSGIAENDVMIGIASNGIHTNGFSLINKIFFKDNNYKINSYINEINSTLGKELLKPHISYIRTLKFADKISGMAHITGGGFGNINRVLKTGLSFKLSETWEIQPIFKLIQKLGKVSDEEMRRVYNMGIGFVVITKEKFADELLNELSNETGRKTSIIGRIIKSA